MALNLRGSRSVVRETTAQYRGKPLMVEFYGKEGALRLWPKGSRQRVYVNLVAAYERGLAAHAPALPTGRQLGMSARKSVNATYAQGGA